MSEEQHPFMDIIDRMIAEKSAGKSALKALDTDMILEDIISGYVAMDVALPDIIDKEANGNYSIENDIIRIYNKIIKLNLDDNPDDNPDDVLDNPDDQNEIEDDNEVFIGQDNDDCDDCEDGNDAGNGKSDEDEQTRLYENLTDDQKQLYNNMRDFRDSENGYQPKYVNDAIRLLDSSKRCLIKCPTGGGKTAIIYKILGHYNEIRKEKIQVIKAIKEINEIKEIKEIKEMNKQSKSIETSNGQIILMQTPRRILNEQSINKKYLKHSGYDLDNMRYFNYSPDTTQKKNDNTEHQQQHQHHQQFEIHTSFKKRNIDLKRALGPLKNNPEKVLIITSCDKSINSLVSFLESENAHVDICICDEAHRIASWVDLKEEYQKKFLGVVNVCRGNPSINAGNGYPLIDKYIFATATPVPLMTNPTNRDIFGQVIDHVQIYELINKGILCDIKVMVKHFTDENKCANICDFTKDLLGNEHKKKAVIFANDQNKAIKLYTYMKTKYPDFPIYLYISRRVNQAYFDRIEAYKDVKFKMEDISIQKFSANLNQAIIITVDKISFGYDDVNIDLIAFADPRKSPIDIRQIIGRGLRNDILKYPGKILHIILPITKRQLLTDPNKTIEKQNARIAADYNEIRAYLQFITEECGKDIINGRIMCVVDDGDIDPDLDNDPDRDPDSESNEDVESDTLALSLYTGEKVKYELLTELSTNIYKSYSRFLGFLRRKGVYDEFSYNMVRENEGSPEWFPILGDVRKSHAKFCFQDINAPENAGYYQTWEECNRAYKIGIKKIHSILGDVMDEYTTSEIRKEINKIDKQIPSISIELYYPPKK